MEKRLNSFSLLGGDGSAKELVPADGCGGEKLVLIDRSEDLVNFVTPLNEGSAEAIRV